MDVKIGLNQREAERRLKQFGENKLKKEKKLTWPGILWNQFKSPMIYILVIASAVTLLLGDIVDAGVIGAAVLLNTLLGFYQEWKAEKGIEALSKILTPKAKVIRDGQRQIIEAREVVPGDVAVLEIGETVPADGVIIEGENLSLNEAILTGESLPVSKHKKDEVFMGTTVVAGIAKMLVKTTGQGTRVGQIAKTLAKTEAGETPLQKLLGSFCKKLAIIIGIICGVIFVSGLIAGDSFLEMFTTSVAVAVSAIPEGLVISLTVILALGMQRIFKRKALVRKLLAAETLGSVTVIACDKTGTLTEGKMRVVKALTKDKPLLRKAAAWCNDLRDPLEIAMKEWAEKHLGGENINTSEVKRLDSIPFDPKTKMIVTLHPGIMFVSGAPEALLQKCSMTLPADATHQALQAGNWQFSNWIKKFDDEARLGHRLVGFAYKKTDCLKIENSKTCLAGRQVENLQWLGALVYEDPVRAGVKDALNEARRAGIKVILITGDYQATAEAVAKQVGIKKEDVFSRATPEQKLKIVEELQSRGEVVAMTGDGVNDALALKKADIGIVVEDASAVAQETADMVLLDSNFATILGAVEEGRRIFLNLSKVVLYLMANAFSEVFLILGSLLVGLPLPVTAGQILWINLVDDSLPDFALILEPKEADLMRGRPRGYKRTLMTGSQWWLSGLISLLTGAVALGVFWWRLKLTDNLELARSLAFTIVATVPLLYSFSIRTLKKPLWRQNIFNNLWLIGAVVIGIIFQTLVLYLPVLQRIFKTTALGIGEWLIVLAAAGIVVMMIEGMKKIWR